MSSNDGFTTQAPPTLEDSPDNSGAVVRKSAPSQDKGKPVQRVSTFVDPCTEEALDAWLYDREVTVHSKDQDPSVQGQAREFKNLAAENLRHEPPQLQQKLAEARKFLSV